MTIIKHYFLHLLLGIFVTCHAQTIPLIVPYTAGGITDRVARTLEKTLSHRLPYNFIVEYHAGAGGIVAANLVAKNKSKETVLLVHSSAVVTNVFNPSATYNLLNDFIPVASIGSLPLALVVNRNSGIKTIKQLSEINAPLFYATNGVGTANHVAGEILRQQLNKDLFPVFYKGESVAFTDLLNNTVPIMFVSIALVSDYITSDKISILAVTGMHRNAKLPGVPTFTEQKIRNFEQSPNWSVVLASPGADPVILSKIRTALTESFADSQDQELYRRVGIEPNRRPTINVREFLVEEIEKIRPMQSILQK